MIHYEAFAFLIKCRCSESERSFVTNTEAGDELATPPRFV